MTVSAETAKQDKIDLSYEGWVFAGDTSGAWVAAIGLADERHTNASGVPQKVFLPLRSNERNRRSFNLRFSASEALGEESEPVYGGPLARGHLYFSFHEPDEYEQDADSNMFEHPNAYYTISAQLSLNPTRAFNHQDIRSVFSHRNEPRFSYPEVTHFTTRDATTARYEYTLDQSDNVIIHPRHIVMARPPHWLEYRNRYLIGVEDFIQTRLERNLGLMYGGQSNLTRNPRYSLTYIENYWEFSCDDPVRMMDIIRPQAQALGRSTRRFGYRYRDYEQNTEGNVSGYRIDMAAGVELSIYAKTSKRIRIEIRHRLSDVPRGVRGLPTRRTSESLEGIFDLMAAITQDATEFAQTALEVLEQALPYGGVQQSPYELVRAVMAAVDWFYSDHPNNMATRNIKRDVQQHILAQLISNNRYVTIDRDPHAPILAKLQRQRIVTQVVRGTRTLAEEYQQARSILAATFPQ